MPAISPPGCACRKSLSARTLSISPRVVPIPSACHRGLHRHVDGQLPPPMTISERHVRKVITRDPDIVVRSPSMLSAVSACHAAVPPWDDSWRRSRVFSTRRRGTISGLSTSERSICCRQTRPHLPTYETSHSGHNESQEWRRLDGVSLLSFQPGTVATFRPSRW